MEAFAYKGISEGKYVDGEIEALNLDEASHKPVSYTHLTLPTISDV